MTKKIIPVLFLITGIFKLHAAQVQVTALSNGNTGLHVTFDAHQLHAVNAPAPGSFIVKMADCTPILREGMPDIPKYSLSLAIGPDEEMEVVFIGGNYTDYTLVNIAPGKGNLYRTTDPSQVPYVYGNVYQQNNFFPGKLSSLQNPYLIRDVRGQTVNLFPVQYNPVTKVLRVYQDMDVRVQVKSHQGINPLLTPANFNESREFIEIYKKQFVNFPQYLSAKYNPIGETGRMLVVCFNDATWIDAMQPFIQWKRMKGISVDMVTYGPGGTLNNATALKSYIASEYAANGLTFLLFVGDNAQIPVSTIGGNPSDNNYVYLSGNDHYPDVLMGRFSAENANHVKTQVARIIQYERDANNLQTYYKNGACIASNQGPGDDNQMDYEHLHEIRTKLLNYTYSSIQELYDGTQTGGNDAPGDPSSANLSSLINNGTGFINYTGHGSNNSIVTTGFDNGDINALTNTGKLPFFLSVGCVNGEFMNLTCFAETWMRAMENNNPLLPRGAIGTFMSTINQSWDPPMEAQDEFNDILIETYTNNIKRTFGGLCFNGCYKMNDSYGGAGDVMTDTWTLFGDPSLVVRTDTPSDMLVTHPATAPIGINQLSVSCNTDGALVSLNFQGVNIGSGLVSGGSVTISFNPVLAMDTIKVVVTAFNKTTYLGNVVISAGNGPFVISQSYTIQDIAGNNNGLADYDENNSLDITLYNAGTADANGVTGTLSCTDPSIASITQSTANFGTITAGNTSVLNNAFSYQTAANITDQHTAAFTLNLNDGQGNNWSQPLTIVLNAPVLAAGQIDINDAAGNNNGYLNSGESIILNAPYYNNGHSDALNTTATLTCSSPYITISNPSINIGSLAATGTQQNASFNILVSTSAPSNANVVFNFTVQSGTYSATSQFAQRINLAVETFESNTMTANNWSLTGTANWYPTTYQPMFGSYCSRSGNVSDSQNSTLSIIINVAASDSISFYHRENSEQDWDFLKFHINNTEKGSWSGATNWTRNAYTVNAGINTFKWTYTKDNFGSYGMDCAFLDDIILPNGTPVGTNEVEIMPSQNSLFPNPVESFGQFTYELSETSPVELQIIDGAGHAVLPLISGIELSGAHQVIFDVSQLSPGMYFLILRTNGQTLQQKFIKQ